MRETFKSLPEDKISHVYLPEWDIDLIRTIIKLIYYGEAKIAMNVQRVSDLNKYAGNMDLDLKVQMIKDKNEEEKETEFENVLSDEQHSEKTTKKSNIGRKKSGQNKVHECEKCDYKTKISTHMKTHVRVKHDRTKLQCEYCELMFTYPGVLKDHRDSAHLNVEYNCKDCEFKSNRRAVFKEHVGKTHKGIKFLCQYCDLQSTRKAYLPLHIRKMHPEQI